MNNTDRIQQRTNTIRALLNKANGTNNQCEADAYREKAFQLMQAYNIELVEQDISEGTLTAFRVQRVVLEGGYYKNQQEFLSSITEHFGCKGISIRTKKADKTFHYEVDIFGRPEQIKLVLELFEALWTEANNWIDRKEYTSKTEKTSFLRGFNVGFANQLRNARNGELNVRSRYGTGRALVLASEKLEEYISDYYNGERIKNSTTAVVNDREAFRDGYYKGIATDVTSR